MHTFKADERSRQEVIQGLQQKLELVEQAIAVLTKSKKCVENNTSMMKANVMHDISDVLSALRNREVNLLRQIDVMEARHLNILNTQYAEVHQILGNLKHVLYCVQQQEDGHAHAFSNGEMELVEMVLKQKVPQYPITYSRDLEEFNAAIQHFGVVASNLSTLQATKDLVSQCLPSKLEEYEDDEQQLLYKTLEEIDTSDCRPKGCLKFPKLSCNKEDWLRKSILPLVEASPAKPEFVLPACFQQKDCNYWLRQPSAGPKLPAGPPSEKKVEEWLRAHSATSVSVCERQRDDKRSSVASDSIEMISHPETHGSGEFYWVPRTESLLPVTDSDGLNCFKGPTQSFLRNSKKNVVPSCCQVDNQNVDIENLHTIPCSANGDGPRSSDVSKWLFNSDNCKREALEQSFREMLQLGGVCCANEPCGSLRDCVCKEECTGRAMEMQTALRKKSTFRVPPKSDEPLWLRVYSSADEKYKWYKSSADACQAEKMDLSEKAHKEDESNQPESGSDDKPSWVKSAGSERGKMDCSSPCIRSDFQRYFLPVDVNVWLVPAKA